MLDWIITIGPKVLNRKSMNYIASVTSKLRINSSHTEPAELKNYLDRLFELIQEIKSNLKIIIDLQGAKLRIGKIIDERRNNKLKSKVLLVAEQESKNISQIPIPHKEFFEIIEPLDEVHINDGYIVLKVLSKKSNNCFEAEVIKNDTISSYKSISIPTKLSCISLRNISNKDIENIKVAKNYKVNEFALSYISSKQEIEMFRNYLGSDVKIITKIERIAALDCLLDLVDLSDELWLCRGDLGAELGYKRIKELYKFQCLFENNFKYIYKPKYLAGEIIKSLIYQKFPTRTEIVHLCKVESDGYNGVVLSDETVCGKNISNIVEFIKIFNSTNI